MRKIYTTSFSYGSNDTLKWMLSRVEGKETIYKRDYRKLLDNYRKCYDNEERFRFINILVDEEREILVNMLNPNEFCGFINILERIEIEDSYVSLIESKITPRLVKVDYVKSKKEILVNNILREVELIKEVRTYE